MSTLQLVIVSRFDWDRIEAVRQASEHAADAALDDPTAAERVAMVTSELLENAFKYGRAGAPIALSIDAGPQLVTVAVTNEADEAGRFEELESKIGWLSGFDDPRDAYTSAMQRAYDDLSEGGLGLVRIAYEGRCTLEVMRTDEGRVRVEARCVRGEARRGAEGVGIDA